MNAYCYDRYWGEPGFPNLSCLGLLADRVLQPSLTRESQQRQEYSATDV